MAAKNTTNLGFGTIALFHLSILAIGVLIQNAYGKWGETAGHILLAAMLVAAPVLGFLYRRFLWDIFRSFKSAGVLITYLVLACVLGTMIIQDLDLRRDGVFDPGTPDKETGVPPFESTNQFTRFALAQSHALLYLFPNDERRRLMDEKVQLSEYEEQQVALREVAFGAKDARTMRQGLLDAKRRQVRDLTTSNYARRHVQAFYGLFTFLRNIHLFDIFESLWFYFLLGLIGINVIVGTIARAPWNARDIGIAITHAGILIVLAGALLDVLKAREGYIHYIYGGRPEDAVSSTIYDQKTKTETNLPFAVRLDRFATEYFHELGVERYDWSRRHDGAVRRGTDDSGSPFTAREQFAIRAGIPRVFEKGKVEVTVHGYKPRVFVRTTVVENEGGPPNHAVRLGVYREANGGLNLLMTGNSEPWLFASDRRRDHLDSGPIRFEFVWAGSGAEFERLVRTAPEPDNGHLVLRLGETQTRVPVQLGHKVTANVGGREVALDFRRIASALAETKNVNVDANVTRSEEPVLYLLVNGREVSVPRDDRAFTKGFELLEGLELRFDWPDPHDLGVFNIYRVVGAADRPYTLVQKDERGEPVANTLAGDAAVPLLGRLDGFHLDIEASVRSAKADRAIREVSDEEFLREGGGSQDRLLAAWADVEITGPWGSVRQDLTPFDRPIFYGDDGNGQPVYAFYLERTNMARDWFSVLTVLDMNGNPVESHNVQVNSPLRHRGYRFFQATADTRENFAISGISVTYNPGVNFMYVGYTVLTFGVCYLFFIKPILVRRWRRRRRRMEAAAS